MERLSGQAELKGSQAGLGVEHGFGEGTDERRVRWGLWSPAASSPAPLLSLV